MHNISFETGVLSNGIRVVYTPAKDTSISHCAILVLSGTREESKKEEGIAHFIEHCVFKGTKKRKAIQVISCLDAVGGELNAYTSKEETAFYTSFQNRYLNKALDLLSDIVFNSQFPTLEIKKEKGVIIDEINSYLDTPSELIFDEFEELLFKGNSIGNSILGNVDSVKSFNSLHLKNFVQNQYLTSRMVLSVSSVESFESIMKKTQNYFGQKKLSKGKYHRTAPKPGKIFHVEKDMENFQCHTVIGGHAPGYNDKKRLHFVLLNNILGGNALNSRLNLSLREKNGFAYTVESVYSPFTDCGSYSIYFGTDIKNNDKCLKLVHKELTKLRDEKISARQLNMYKTQLKGHLALSEENRSGRVISRAKTFGIFNRLFTYQEICDRIDSITAEQLRDTAQFYYDPKKLSSLIYKSV